MSLLHSVAPAQGGDGCYWALQSQQWLNTEQPREFSPYSLNVSEQDEGDVVQYKPVVRSFLRGARSSARTSSDAARGQTTTIGASDSLTSKAKASARPSNLELPSELQIFNITTDISDHGTETSSDMADTATRPLPPHLRMRAANAAKLVESSPTPPVRNVTEQDNSIPIRDTEVHPASSNAPISRTGSETLDKIQRLIEEQRKAAHVTTSSSTFAATNGHIDAKAVNHAQQRPLVATAPDTVGHTIISVSGGAALVTYSDSDSPKKDTTPATSFQKSINSKEAPPRKVAPSTSAFKHADRSSKWPKASVTRADPKRWDITWSSHSSAVADDVDSAIADNGQNPNKKATRRASVDSQGYKLVDWTGTWAPAPVDWDARPAFRDKQSAIQIESWMDKIEEDMHNIDWKLPMHDIEVRDTKYYFAPNPKKHDLTLMGEPVPRYWIPTTMGRQAPQTFWSDLVKSEEPQPVDEDDLVDVKPWWEHLPSAQCHFLRPYVQPWIKGIDPDESIEERIARENDNGSSRHAENRRRTERAKQTAKRDSRKRALELAARRTASGSLPIRNPHAPLLNIYIRRATLRDMPEIRDIYNHYVDHGVCTPETSGRTTLDMQERFQDTQTNTLPYLVACERGGTSSKGQRRARKFNADFVLPDRIVGFAHADDYNDMLSMYRFTAEIEVFTHKEFLMKGIAKCLLDKLIGLLDPGYVERGGFEVVGDDLIGIGPSRLIKMIVCNFPYDAKKPEKVEWVGRWLCSPEWLGFKEVGNLEGVGNKEGKVVNLAIFQKTTGATLDPENPPIMMRG